MSSPARNVPRVVVVALLALVAAGCSQGTEPTGTAPATTIPRVTTSPSSQATTTTPTGGSSGVLFVDPDGTYQMEVSPMWVSNHGSFIAGLEVWYMTEPTLGIAPNVNVLSQVVPQEMTLDEYHEASIANAALLIEQFELIDEGIVTGRNQQLGMLDYAGVADGSELRFLAFYAVDDGVAVIATFTAEPDQFEILRDEIEPYLLTLVLVESP